MPQNLPDADYDHFQIWRTRVRSNGLAVMPTAGPSPQPLQIVALHGGAEFELIVFSAARRGAMPVVPSPQALNGNTNRIFLGGSQSACDPLVDFGGIYTYAVAGAYLYAIINPEGLASQMQLAAGPWPGIYLNEQYVPAANINPSQLINKIQNQQLPPASGSLPQAISQQG